MIQRIFTDGACSGNPGPGGWAAVFNLHESSEVVSGYEVDTTNNRMELLAVVGALETATKREYDKRGRIEIHSDSAYIVNAINKGWLDKWKKNGWQTAKKEPVKNKDLWVLIDKYAEGLRCKVSFIKVKGHSGNTFNELADKHAVQEVQNARRELAAQKIGGIS